MKLTIFVLLSSFSLSVLANRAGHCQAHFIIEGKNKRFEEALCAQNKGVAINLNKNGAVSRSFCGKEWNILNNEIDLIYVKFKTKRKGDQYLFGVDLLRGGEEIRHAKRIGKDRQKITRDGKIQGRIALSLESQDIKISGISYDCQIDQFSL